jgi:hypothetical protein
MARPSSQEVAVLIPLLLSLLTALATIVIHAVALGATVRFIRDCPILDRRCHRGRRYNAGPNRALGDNHNLGDVILYTMFAGNSPGLTFLFIIRR